jgi:hypothetical protein
MRLLDWIKNRNRPDPSTAPEFSPKEYGHSTWEGLWAEIRHDEALAKIRNETGREPPSGTIEPERNSREADTPLSGGNTSDAKTQQPKQSHSWER